MVLRHLSKLEAGKRKYNSPVAGVMLRLALAETGPAPLDLGRAWGGRFTGGAAPQQMAL